MAEALETPTLIIGGSAAGMGVARSLQERGLRAIIIESEPEVGIRWRTAYDRLHLHTPRSTSGLPYEPMPASYPRYPSRQQVADYLSHYAAKLTQPILFNRRAVSVRRDDDRWITETAEGAIVSANVVIATGHSMLGLSLGAGTGKLVSELVDERPTSIDLTPFAVERFD